MIIIKGIPRFLLQRLYHANKGNNVKVLQLTPTIMKISHCERKRMAEIHSSGASIHEMFAEICINFQQLTW